MKNTVNTLADSIVPEYVIQIPYATLQTGTVKAELPLIAKQRDIKYRSTVSSLQSILMTLLTLQQINLPLLVRFAKRQGSGFLPTVLVFVTEVLKLLICSLIIIVQHRSPKKFVQDVCQHIIRNICDTARTSIPAFAYALQNNLYYIALHHINAAEYTATYQLRILTTAILSVIMLKKVISSIQWLSLLSLLIGVILVQIPQTSTTKLTATPTDGIFVIGILSVFTMCWTSAFAGVYFEKVLKKSMVDIWIENLRLGLMTLIFAAITMIASDGRKIQTGGFFQGWNGLIWIIVILNSLGGLTVSAVMKYADNIKKTLCQSVAIACTSVLAVITNDAQPNSALFSGVFLVTISTYVYSTEPPKTEILQ